MKKFQAIIKNKEGIIISAPAYMANSIEEFNEGIERHFMTKAACTWLRTDDKMAASYTSHECKAL